MIPIFKTSNDWELAELLMQPSLIRVMDNLRKKLDDSVWEGTYTAVENPYPGHQLQLTYQDHKYAIALWDICFEVCFLDYQALILKDDANVSNQQQEVNIDTSLFEETGEIDWQNLDNKTQRVINTLFVDLPTF